LIAGVALLSRAGARYRTLTGIVHELVDIVSKNGNMVLNVPPKGMDSG